MTMTDLELGAALIGAWTLDAWRIEYADGRVTEPFGPTPRGLLIYSVDGRMSALLTRAERPGLGGASARRADEAARAQAFDDAFGYAGRFDVLNGAVNHRVEVAFNPDFLGTVQTRSIDLTGDRLTLSATESEGGRRRRHVLAWRRVEP